MLSYINQLAALHLSQLMLMNYYCVYMGDGTVYGRQRRCLIRFDEATEITQRSDGRVNRQKRGWESRQGKKYHRYLH